MQFLELNYGKSPSKSFKFPLIVLVKDGWNDYGFYTLYNLVYYREFGDYTEIGNVKILEKNSDSTSIPSKFKQLSNDYCSLGQSLEFYEKLKKILPKKFEDVFKCS